MWYSKVGIFHIKSFCIQSSLPHEGQRVVKSCPWLFIFLLKLMMLSLFIFQGIRKEQKKKLPSTAYFNSYCWEQILSQGRIQSSCQVRQPPIQNKTKSPLSKTVCKNSFQGKSVVRSSQSHILISERSVKEGEFICAKDFRGSEIFIWPTFRLSVSCPKPHQINKAYSHHVW